MKWRRIDEISSFVREQLVIANAMRHEDGIRYSDAFSSLTTTIGVCASVIAPASFVRLGFGTLRCKLM